MREGSAPTDSDGGYDVRRQHPERHRYYEKFAEGSQRARRNLPNICDVSYGVGQREKLDVFSAGPHAPAVIFIHGGFWQAHDKSEFSFVSTPLYEAGVATFVANYSRAPDTPILGLMSQIEGCCAWVYENAANFSIDPGRIFVCGHSAGAHLAAAALSADWTARGLPPDLLKGACLVSGIFDLAPLCGTKIAARLDLVRKAANAASPVRMRCSRQAKLLVAVGADESDAFIDQSQRMADVAKGWGNPVELQILDGMNHYDTALALGECNGVTVERFLRLVLDRA